MTLKVISPLIINDTNLIDAGTNVPEDDAPLWLASETYAIGDEVMYQHVIYSSLTDANTGNNPKNDGNVNWFAGLATNRWKVFDGYLQDRASNPDTLTYQMASDGYITSVALIGITGASVTVRMEQDGGVVLYDKTFQVLDETGIDDYDKWFFAPSVQEEDLAITDIPSALGQLTVTVDHTGSNPALAQLAVGTFIEVGLVVNGLDQDLELFSDKTTDTFGRISGVKRGSSDIFEPVVKIDTSRINFLRAELKKRESVATVYVLDGPTKENEYIAFGDFERLRTVSRFGKYSEMQITIREYV